MAKSAEEEHPTKTKAFGVAATDTSGFLSPFKFSRRFSASATFFFSSYLLSSCRMMKGLGLCNLQGNRRKRRKVEGALLWNMSLRSTHDQEWLGHFHLPCCSRVCYVPALWARSFVPNFESGFSQQFLIQHGFVCYNFLKLFLFR